MSILSSTLSFRSFNLSVRLNKELNLIESDFDSNNLHD
jgi:hypothetical protein